MLVSTSWDGKARVYQVAESGNTIQSSMALQFAHDAAQSSPILDAAWSTTGPQIVTVGVNNQVMLYDCQSQQSQQLGSHDQPVRTVRFMPDQPNTLVTGSWDKTIRVRRADLGDLTRAVLADEPARASRDEADA